MALQWNNAINMDSWNYTCGYCGSTIASEKGWIAAYCNARIFLCHKCGKPTFIDLDLKQYPGIMFGNSVQHIPEQEVNGLYDEARQATGVGAYTAAVLCCRKLLMHIAVSKGADEDKPYAYYVDYLAENHFIPPDARGWVDHIRKKGNDANHDITIMAKEDAEELLEFCEMLLKVIYEFPRKVTKKYLSAKGVVE